MLLKETKKLEVVTKFNGFNVNIRDSDCNVIETD